MFLVGRFFPACCLTEFHIIKLLPVWSCRRLRGSLGGTPEPLVNRLCFVIVFVMCMARMRAGKAKLQVRASFRVFLLTLALAVGSCAPFAASLRGSECGVHVGLKAGWIQISPRLQSLRVFDIGFLTNAFKTYT